MEGLSHKQIKAWRRALHAWDKGGPSTATATSEGRAGSDGADGTTTHQQQHGEAEDEEEDEDIVPLAALEELGAEECVLMYICGLQTEARGCIFSD